MKKLISGVLLAVLILALAACGTKNTSEKEITKLTIGASNTPHAIILEQAKPLLKEKGYDLQIETYQDYVLPNKDLESGELDANYFQHIPYLELQIEDNGYDFVNVGGIHIEPIGVYSKKYKSLDELPNGATILMSSSISDHGRVLAMLESKGLIKLDVSVAKTAAELDDIVENPKNIKFDANYEPGLMPQLYSNDEGDALLINSNFAIDAGLNPIEDSIAIEDADSPYVNIITVRKDDEDKDSIKALIEVLKSKEIQDFILKEWGGTIVPVK